MGDAASPYGEAFKLLDAALDASGAEKYRLLEEALRLYRAAREAATYPKIEGGVPVAPPPEPDDPP